MKILVTYRFWLILVFSQPFTGYTQTILFNRVSPPEGKIFEHITGMVQDRQGYMWLASKRGLFRYDGHQMKLYTPNPLDPNSLASNLLEAICMDTAGKIWLGTMDSGLERFDPETGIFTHYRQVPGDPSSLQMKGVWALLVDREGTLWIGGDGLGRFDPMTGKFTHFRHRPDDPASLSSNEVISIYEDRQGELWIGTGSVYSSNARNPAFGGLNRMHKRSGTFTRYLHDPRDPTSLANNKVRAIYEDRKGNFWVGTAGDGLHTMDRSTGKFKRYPYDPRHPEKLSRPPLKKEPFFDHITFIRDDTTGAIWIGTAESGLNHYNPETQKTTHYELNRDSEGSFNDRTPWYMYESAEGVLWISTLFGNLYRINPLRGKIPHYAITDRGIHSFYEEPNGTVWLGSELDGLLQTDGKGVVMRKYAYDPRDPGSISSAKVHFVTADRKGDILAGTFGGGLNILDRQKGTFVRYVHDPENDRSLSNNHVLFLYEGGGADLWVATLRGLNRMDREKGTFTRFIFFPADSIEINTNIVTSVLKDRTGKWWAGSWMKGGIQQFNPLNGKFKTYLKGASIMVLREGADGLLWAGSSEGLFYYDRDVDRFLLYDDPVFLNENTAIFSLLEDDQGSLWASTPAGIIRINRKRNETSLYGINYGVIGEDLGIGAGYKGRDGKLFFGNVSGYYAFYPNEFTQGMKPPAIILSEFRVANKLVTPGDGGPLQEPLSQIKSIRLRHSQNVFSFDFAGIDFANPSENRHLFMLENYDEDWNLASSERRAIYFNVPPGRYVFRVKVANSYGVWAERSIEVIITPPWWSTWWFRIAAVLSIAGIFYAVVRWRMNQKFNRQLEISEKEKQLAELQHKTSELEMQALRAQMNPHFIFNSLNSINRFILQNNKTQASEYLTKFSRLVRMILQNSQAALITLESELESLKLYLELEAVRFDHRFTYNIAVAGDLEIEDLKVPPLIIQPYAENAIWHGLMHKEEKGHLEIEVTRAQGHLTLKITDDGIGRRQSAAMTSKSATLHKSMGLKITADRIAMLERLKGGQAESPVSIRDLVHPDGTAAGTQVIIKIPAVYD